MEEMVTHIIVYLLKIDGTYIKEVYELSREMMLSECMAFAQDHREAISTYDDINNRWWLKDESGNAWFGSECIKK